MLPLLVLAPLVSSASWAGQGEGKNLPAWRTEPYLEPHGGLSSFTSGGATTTAAYLGADAGVRYQRRSSERPTWAGRTRVAGTYVFGSNDTSGIDLRLGSFIGPVWDHLTVQTGPDLFWNRYSWSGLELEPTAGLAWPVSAATGIDAFTVWGSVEPAWLSNADRRVDWESTDSALPGFGHEFTYVAGITLQTRAAGLSVGYKYRITAFGVEQGLMIGASVGR